MPQGAIDYARLAQQHGGQAVTPSPPTAIDYGALAREFGGQNVNEIRPDFRMTVKASEGVAGEHPHARTARWAGEALRGAAKGAVETIGHIADLTIRQIPGATEYFDVPVPPIPIDVTARTPAEHIGKTTERIAEVLAPSRAITNLGVKAATVGAPFLARAVGHTVGQLAPRVAVEAAGSAGLAAMQGGDPRVAAIVGGAIPVVGQAVAAAAPPLQEAAKKLVVQALGPTKERFKAIAERRAAEILKRGLGGSRESLKAQSQEMVEQFGEQIDDAIRQYGERAVDTRPIVDALERSKATFQTVARDGKTVVFDPRAVKQLSGLQRIIAELGPEARVDQLVAVRRAWDKVVADAGGYAHRAAGAIGTSLKEQSEAWAKRQATSAIRRLLDVEVPELSAINKEFAFWKDLDDVLTQTLKRTQPQGPGVGRLMAEGAGQMVGGVAGSGAGTAGTIGGAIALGKLSKMASAVFTSPRWRLANARLKDALADAIVNNQAGPIASVLARVGAVQGSQIPVPATR
jgi:hypothetical protein